MVRMRGKPIKAMNSVLILASTEMVTYMKVSKLKSRDKTHTNMLQEVAKVPHQLRRSL